MTTNTSGLEGLTKSFLDRELPSLIGWIKALESEKQDLLLADMPINKIWDLPDDKKSLSVGEEEIRRTESSAAAQASTPFCYAIRCRGDLGQIMSYLQQMKSSEQQEAAMAFWRKSRSGDFFSNHEEAREYVRQNGGRLPENVAHPLYAAVCEGILSRFKQEGWIN